MPKRGHAAGEIPPAGVSEVLAPHPLEISGVAAVPGGYAVVGDEDNEHGRIWPGGARFDFAGKLKGPESIDVGIRAGDEALWLVLGENKGRLIDLDGGVCEFAEPFPMRHGRGLEGLAVRWRDGRWQVALAWEGGFYDWDSPAHGTCAKPRIALLTWIRGEGMRGGPEATFELEVPEPSTGQCFRARSGLRRRRSPGAARLNRCTTQAVQAYLAAALRPDGRADGRALATRTDLGPLS